jgi:hypothetical protein
MRSLKLAALSTVFNLVFVACAHSDEAPDAPPPAEPPDGGDAGVVLDGASQDARSLISDAGPCDLAGGPLAGQNLYVAFDSDRDDGNRNIFVERVDGTNVTRITNYPGTEQDPAVSPDAKELAFASDESGSLEIWMLDLASNARTKVTSMGVAGADEPSWSHDMKSIAFRSGTDIHVIGVDGTGEHMIIKGPDTGYGGGVNMLNGFRRPRFIGDDAHLLISGVNEVYTVDLAGNIVRTIVDNGPYTATMASLSPDETELAVVRQCLQNSSTATVTREPAAADRADYCNGAGVEIVGYGTNPAAGPDRVVAYQSNSDLVSGGRSDILLTAPACTVDRPFDLTLGQGDNASPSWPPAGFVPPAGVGPT